MRPTRPGVLLGAAVLAAALGWATFAVADSLGYLPSVPLLASLTLLLLALWMLFTAVSMRARLRRRPGTRPVSPFVAARMAALAKAGSLGGSLVAGAYAGAAAFFLLDLDTDFDRERALNAVLAVGGALAVVLVALFLERVCRLPDDASDDEDDDEGSPDRGSTTHDR
ncbi:MAG: DUF3180 domain-containing protein [Actinomycetes bacterium]